MLCVQVLLGFRKACEIGFWVPSNFGRVIVNPAALVYSVMGACALYVSLKYLRTISGWVALYNTSCSSPRMGFSAVNLVPYNKLCTINYPFRIQIYAWHTPSHLQLRRFSPSIVPVVGRVRYGWCMVLQGETNSTMQVFALYDRCALFVACNNSMHELGCSWRRRPLRMKYHESCRTSRSRVNICLQSRAEAYLYCPAYS